MDLYGKKSISQALLILLNLLIGVGTIITIYVYHNILIQNLGKISQADIIVSLVLITIGTICTFLILFDLRKVVKTLINKNPFTNENVYRLKKISVQCFIISICYVLSIIYNSSGDTYRFIYIDKLGIHTETEPLIFFLAGVFLLILSAVFKQALEYKEENDYTI